ncbi:MAG: PEP-utilizing enzyme [Candidatus Paceibacteria bacterium]
MSIGIPKNTEFYKQEGDILPFTCMPWVKVSVDFNDEFFDNDLKHLYAFFRDEYALMYWDTEAFGRVAQEVFENFGEDKGVELIFKRYKKFASKLEQLFIQNTQDDVSSFSDEELLSFFDSLREVYHSFWQVSLFIDSFDAGYDQKKIDEIKDRYGLNSEEVERLTTPREMTFKNKRLLTLLELIEDFEKQNKYETIEEFVGGSDKVDDYIKTFDYYKSGYANIEHITKKDVIEEMVDYIKDPEKKKEKLQRLRSYKKNQKELERKILKKYNLDKNPLYFFQKLTYWREHRKEVNLKGIHLLHYILSALEERTDINYEYLAYLKHKEVRSLLEGNIDLKLLKRRLKKGFFVVVTKKETKYLSGERAIELKNSFNNLLKEQQGDTINGTPACSGNASGRVRVVMSQDQFNDFKEGEILVTGMTRPEFVPIMKKSAAIVTDEGGITSHAAIVSREINTPCIIGTQNATEVLEDGGKVKVNANEGIVKKID